MKLSISLTLLTSLGFLIGCASFGTSVDISAGRIALINQNYSQALPRFEKAAQLEPGYVTTFTEFPENVWTYVGRSYYGLGDLKQARAALDRSVQMHPKAILGHVYLGLVQMRQGQVQPGLRNAEKGLRFLQQWFQTLDATNQYSSYWDPSSQIRNTTKQLIEQIQGGEIPWQRIASKLDWIGMKMEREINLSSRDITDALTEGDNWPP
jgi:tetratricopeptide (TPR) repeat protein